MNSAAGSDARSAASASGLMSETEDSHTLDCVADTSYNVVTDPKAEKVDLSNLRGVSSAEVNDPHDSETDLENLAELVPDVKARRNSMGEVVHVVSDTEHGLELMDSSPGAGKENLKTDMRRSPVEPEKKEFINRVDSMQVQDSNDLGEKKQREDQDGVDTTSCDDANSDHAIEDHSKIPKEFHNMASSAQSISTATQTHEVRMPMYLPTFKPATGCTNASDFIVRCFVARLRSGITVVKHGRSRWCKSRLRILHIHPDGRSLSWKPAEGEPTSSKRPPKLDLTCVLEVRHAWSPDPQNPMYTGTSILRQKCEAANAHKSFALIFKQRTVDITAVTADQCKVLMEGFSALCFRLQVANLAKQGQHARPMPEEDGVSTTASATLTNSSTPRLRT